MVAAPTIVLGDNKQAVKWSREDYVTPGNRYYARDLRFIKRRVEDGTIDTRVINTKDNYSDLNTKSVGVAEIKALRGGIRGSDALLPKPPPAPAT